VFGVGDMLRLLAVDPVTLAPLAIQFGEALRRPRDEPFLAILSGVDRAPLEVALADVVLRRIGGAGTDRQPNGDRIERTHPGVIATMLPGPSTFRLARALRPHVALVHCGWDRAHRSDVGTSAPTTALAKGFQLEPVSTAMPPAVLQATMEGEIRETDARTEISLMSAALGSPEKALSWWAAARLSGSLAKPALERLIDQLCGGNAAAHVPSLPTMMRDIYSVVESE
jgi:hypothetical protein